MAAQNWAQTLISRGTASIDPNTGYGTNVFTKIGAQTGLAQTSVVTWYTSVKHYDWARRQLKVLALPFIHLIWLSSNFVGVGLSRSPTAKFFVVVYFDPMPGNKPPSLLKENVLPYTGTFKTCLLFFPSFFLVSRPVNVYSSLSRNSCNLLFTM